MSEEAVCQTCGNRGFPEALNYCMTCGEAAEHTYCLEKLPEDLSEDISWTCESCMSTTVGELSQNPSAVLVVEGQGTGTCIQEAPYILKGRRGSGLPPTQLLQKWEGKIEADLLAARWIVQCQTLLPCKKWLVKRRLQVLENEGESEN